MPLQGRATANGDVATIGECLLLDEGAKLFLADLTIVLVGVEGNRPAVVTAELSLTIFGSKPVLLSSTG